MFDGGAKTQDKPKCVECTKGADDDGCKPECSFRKFAKAGGMIKGSEAGGRKERG